MRAGARLAVLVAGVVVAVAGAAQELPAVRTQSISVYANDLRFSTAAKQRYAGQRVQGKYRLHLNGEGRVGDVDAVEPIAEADEGVRATLKRYKFKPPGQPSVTFIMPVELNFIAAATDGYRAVPPTAMEGQRLSGATPHLPRGLHTSDKTVVGMFLLYVELDGSVSRVDVSQSVAGADDGIVATLRTWKFRPQPERVKAMQTLTFKVEP